MKPLSAARLTLLLGSVALPFLSHAACTGTVYSQPGDHQAALIPFGKIDVSDSYLQPSGTLVASAVVPPTNYTYNGANAATVVWECAKADLSGLYFLVATNGDDRVGGYWETGTTDGLAGVFATWFQYIGLKQTMSGVTLNRYWQRIPLTSYAEVGDTIQIRLQDIPPMQAELYRLSTLPPATGAPANACGSDLTTGAPTSGGRAYSCAEPHSYVQLVGPGLTYDPTGSDSATNRNFMNSQNGFSYSMKGGSSLASDATCVARNATPLVTFPTLYAQQLNNGVTSQANFTVEIECSNSAASGTGNHQTAIGIQASSGAYAAAQKLGLVNAAGGVTALVSDNYGNDPTLAEGVGITLQNTTTNTDINLVGVPGMSRASTTPSDLGWYPVLDGATSLGSSQSGYTSYQQTYTATLRSLTGLAPNAPAVRPGKLHATTYVLVRLQ